MRWFSPTIITISQLFGALVVFSFFDKALKQTPFSTLGPLQKAGIGGSVLVHLLSLVGSILIWLSRRPG